MFSQRCQWVLWIIFTLAFYLTESTPLQAANLTLSTTSTPDSEVLVLEIDKVEKLAGMKLTIEYPARFLEYKASQKASPFNSFMQVVNDKNPGRLILVMANATGVSGENLKIFELTFSKKMQNLPATLKIAPTECQLMSDSLQEIPCTTSPITVPISK
jgi:hypothetical protein